MRLLTCLAVTLLAQLAYAQALPPLPDRGLMVHVGPANADAAIAAAKRSNLIIHVLIPDSAAADAALVAVREAGLSHRVAVEHWSLNKLPYPDHYANVILAEPSAKLPNEELTRALAPGGMGLVLVQGEWTKITKKRPPGMDDWTHQRHAADGNPVSRDAIRMTDIPDRLRWAGDTLRIWSHGMRVCGGRMYLFIKDTVRCRDAFNGTFLWEETYPGVATSSSPGSASSRPVVTEDRVYVYGTDGIVVIDAATGKQLDTFKEAARPIDFVATKLAGGQNVLLCRTADAVLCLDALTGKVRWKIDAPIDPAKVAAVAKGGTPAAAVSQVIVGDGRVYFATGKKIPTTQKATPKSPAPADGWQTIVLGIDLDKGAEVYRSEDPVLGTLASPMIHADGVLLGCCREGIFGLPVDAKDKPWLLNVWTWLRPKGKPPEAVTALDPRNMTIGFMQAGGLLWVRDAKGMVFGEKPATTQPSPKNRGWAGINPRTGKIDRTVGYPVEGDWSPRCYADIASSDCILSQTMEIVSIDGKELKHIRGVRGQCGIGFILGNNTVYTPSNQCIGCYPMIRGCVAYDLPTSERFTVDDATRLQKGPAFEQIANGNSQIANDQWPMYRQNPLRTGCTLTAATGQIKQLWSANVGDRCTQPVIAGGRAFTSVINQHRIVCLDAATGKQLWQFSTPARVETSPTIAGDFCLFGAHDGYVYCLRTSDGQLVWRFNAAPEHRRVLVSDQMESPWPVFGAVLVYDGAVFATAGQYSAIDGGLHFWGLDIATGKPRFHQVFSGIKGDKAVILPTHWYKHEDHALNNILVADKGKIRLYEEWGGWEYSPKDGSMLRALYCVPQPGFPIGRLSPGDPKEDDRWPWAGFDRVSVQYIMQGQIFGQKQVLDLDPRTRYSGVAGHFCYFPDTAGPGIYLRSKGTGTEIEPEPWLVPSDPKTIGFKEVWAKDPDRLAGKARLWPARQLPLRVQASLIAGKDKEQLWLVGTISGADEDPQKPQSELRLISMRDGNDVGTWKLEGEATWDALSLSQGRLYLGTHEGRVICFGQ